MRKNLKIKRGSAEYSGIFEQNNIRGCTFKSLIAVPKQFECSSIRLHNALMLAQYELQREIVSDEELFDRCYLNDLEWEYEQGS
jgi:hypothetical protein